MQLFCNYPIGYVLTYAMFAVHRQVSIEYIPGSMQSQ